jgi:hypothetical protein
MLATPMSKERQESVKKALNWCFYNIESKELVSLALVLR